MPSTRPTTAGSRSCRWRRRPACGRACSAWCRKVSENGPNARRADTRRLARARPDSVTAPEAAGLILRCSGGGSRPGGWRLGGRRSGLGRQGGGTGGSAAVLLVVPFYDLGGDVDPGGGPQHRALLAGDVEHDGQRIGLGIFVNDGDHALADLVDHLLLFLRHFVLQVFGVPLVLLALVVDLPAEPLARFGRHRIGALV